MRTTPLWTAAEAAAATAGTANGIWQATGVSIDSRSVRQGDLFIALRGPKFDGHAFVADALANGAVAAMVDRDVDGLPGAAPLLRVADTMQGLEDLGRRGRARSAAKIIGITGSVGKTGTKEALKLALTAQGQTHASLGSLNNHWGVPLSLSRLPPKARFGVFELGMNHAGEIGPLSRMVQPHAAIITTIERVHIENFDSIEGIADAKAEIFEGMDTSGIAILNRDNAHFAQLVGAAKTRGLGTIWSFGMDERSDARLLNTHHSAHGSDIHAEILGQRIRYTLPVPGQHWAINSLAVLLAVKAAEGDVETAATSLRELRAPSGRGNQHRLGFGDGSLLLIDESYNASPVAMRAAFQVVAGTEPGQGGRRIAVLGDMLELGDEGPSEHAGLIDPLIAARFDRVYTCGPLMAHLDEALPLTMRGYHAADSAGLAEAVCDDLRAGDIVLVKGSAGSRMGKVIDAILALADDNGPPRAVNGG